MIKRAFLIHGTHGNPDENWFPSLKRDLDQSGIETISPAFPTPANQTLQAWYQVMAPHLAQIDGQTILIGHSLGAPFILNLLQDHDIQPKACFLVCPFTGTLYNPEIDALNHSIAERLFDWTTINTRCKQFVTYYSDNDPYVPQALSQSVARQLNAKEFLVPRGGHLNSAAGYTKFPLLAKHISFLN